MQTSPIFEAALRNLSSKYPYAALTAIEAGREIGYSKGTTYNLISEGRFPLPMLNDGGKYGPKRVSIYALAAFLAGGSAAVEPKPAQVKTITDDTPPRRRPGRPSNAERAARAQLLRDPQTADFVNGVSDGEGEGAK